ILHISRKSKIVVPEDGKLKVSYANNEIFYLIENYLLNSKIFIELKFRHHEKPDKNSKKVKISHTLKNFETLFKLDVVNVIKIINAYHFVKKIETSELSKGEKGFASLIYYFANLKKEENDLAEKLNFLTKVLSGSENDKKFFYAFTLKDVKLVY